MRAPLSWLAEHAELGADTDEVVRRLSARAAEQGRSDDTEDVIRHRLDVYERETAPLIAIFADVIAPYSPTKVDNTARLQPPSAAHWLGTTHIGEDVLSQVIHGTRGVIVVGFLIPPVYIFIDSL